jgi:hypothetical protein
MGESVPHSRGNPPAVADSPEPRRLFRDLAADPGAVRTEPRALESFKVGCHHRITRRARVDWLARNQ